MTHEPKPGSGRGCFFYGCLGSAAIFLVLLGLMLLGLHRFRTMIQLFTDTAPTPLPAVQLSAADREKLERRIDDFQDSVRAGRPTPPLTLTADELNAMIATNPELKDLKGKLYVIIETNQLKAQVSVRLGDIGSPFFRNRYLNGVGTVSIALKDSFLQVRAEELLVKGKALPGVFFEKIQKQNLARKLNENPRVSIALERLQDIQVKDGKIIIVPKAAP
jgi:hypothetical protein